MGGGMGGHHRGGRGSPAEDGDRRSDAVRQMDDNDAKAYLDAEALLTDEQRPRAREIAEQYREQLFEWREAMSARTRNEPGEAPAQPQ